MHPEAGVIGVISNGLGEEGNLFGSQGEGVGAFASAGQQIGIGDGGFEGIGVGVAEVLALIGEGIVDGGDGFGEFFLFEKGLGQGLHEASSANGFGLGLGGFDFLKQSHGPVALAIGEDFGLLGLASGVLGADHANAGADDPQDEGEEDQGGSGEADFVSASSRGV
jgi:hypothetical protein